MRLFIRQLLVAQEQSNEIQRERLNLERERLEFERSAVDRLLTAIPSVFSPHQTHQQPQHLHLQAQQGVVSAPTTMLFNPSKLIFTSAGGAAFASNIPTAAINGATTVFAPASNFATATPLTSVAASQAQMEVCTQINDFQFLTPKLEKEE